MSFQVDYYVSLNSPWTHLGGTRLMDIAARCGASVRIYPIDTAEVFPASGGLPLPKRSPQRQAYRIQELARWRDVLAIPINLKPKHFPAKEAVAAQSVLAVRETIGDAPAIDLAHRILKALWEEEADTGDRETLVRLIGEIGLDGTSILELAGDGRWAALRSQETRAAINRGVFGVPTYAVGESIFWGQDRLDFLERQLRAGR
ncbi:2-hydroxychromene-2-carboxylate isomerase [Methylobacterium sp. J-070]|uniref:2-hydroxychromene-2-carboxylate isomerase n=1 Tax=Methylobacterium sp. J-070 TaxID=2836650 RepID=UPI00244469B2|nr:2-hydroxychromene-2-carboxylate isomerase [Methylobacterium sp. J-070]